MWFPQTVLAGKNQWGGMIVPGSRSKMPGSRILCLKEPMPVIGDMSKAPRGGNFPVFPG